MCVLRWGNVLEILTCDFLEEFSYERPVIGLDLTLGGGLVRNACFAGFQCETLVLET